MAGNKRKKAQQKILFEIQSQLTLKARKLGVDDIYAGVNFESMKLEAAGKILEDLKSEKTNLEYELHMKGILDKESTIKLEKINTYINKATRVIERYQKVVGKAGARLADIKEKGKEAAKKLTETPKINISR